MKLTCQRNREGNQHFKWHGTKIQYLIFGLAVKQTDSSICTLLNVYSAFLSLPQAALREGSNVCQLKVAAFPLPHPP